MYTSYFKQDTKESVIHVEMQKNHRVFSRSSVARRCAKLVSHPVFVPVTTGAEIIKIGQEMREIAFFSRTMPRNKLIMEPPTDGGYLCQDPISTYYIFATYHSA